MNRLRELKENLGLRQIDVSNATRIDQKTLSNYETGKTNPDSYALISLANFFNVSIDYIVGRTEISLFNREDVSKKIDSIKKDLDNIKRYLEGKSVKIGRFQNSPKKERAILPFLFISYRYPLTALALKPQLEF